MNILVVTPIYPRTDAPKNTTATKVIHYFADEWRKMGHNVCVIHTPNRLMKIFYVMPQWIKNILKAKTGNEFPDVKITKKAEYSFEGINAFRRPVFKLIPRKLSSDREIAAAARDINAFLEKTGFVPDIILGHWATPSVQLLNELNRYYNCRKSIVFHDDYYTGAFNAKMIECMRRIDAVGCRSVTLAEKVKKQLKLESSPFICYSGVPDDVVSTAAFDPERAGEPLNRFIYVGELIQRKYCDVVIKALARLNVPGWRFDVIGVGNDRGRFEQLAESLGVSDRVTFHGRVPREKVFELLAGSQCFIMPSKNEAFGLVYLEAMVSSCIAVGSVGEGIDGIIRNGENGLLVEPGNEGSLYNALSGLMNMSAEERTALARRGFETAVRFTDSNVARSYLSDAENWK
ncbi:MAG: glycosyltransferase family 4 protein [Clostridiales bacterium]|nr:glycosyltransferase family 4 protein [Clostridiales bacterium]